MFRRVLPLILTLAAILTACQASRLEVAPEERQTARPGSQPAAAPAEAGSPSQGAAATQPAPPVASTPAASTPAPPPVPWQKVRVKLSEVAVKGSQGEWQPVESGATLPPADLTLRFRYQADLAPAEFEAWLTGQLDGGRLQFQHPAPGVSLVSLETPPPYFRFYGEEAFVGLYTGEPPQLAALDLERREEHLIGVAPSSVVEGAVSPDGRWAVLGAYNSFFMNAEAVWLIDLATGESRLLPVKAGVLSGPFVWYEDQLVIPTGRLVQYWDLKAGQLFVKEGEAVWWPWNALSPDGRFLAGFTPGKGDEGRRIAPATVVIHDLKTRTERLFPDLAGSLVRSCSVQLFMAWEEGGRVLLVEDHDSWEAGRVLRVERESGAVSPDRERAALPPPDWDKPLLPPGPTGWQVLNQDWGPLQFRSPQGESFPLGEGFPVGWLPDGRLILVRWAHFEYRMLPDDEC